MSILLKKKKVEKLAISTCYCSSVLSGTEPTYRVGYVPKNLVTAALGSFDIFFYDGYVSQRR